MGYYIETGGVYDKADVLVKRDGAEIIEQPKRFDDIPDDKALICVVDNLIFEAAGYAFSLEEFEAFSDPADRRDKSLVDDGQSEGRGTVRVCR